MNFNKTPEDAKKRMSQVISSLIQVQPFFAIQALNHEFVPDDKIKTMCTNGYTVRYNPELVNEMRFDHLTGMVAHEILHEVSLHHTRMGNRNIKRWNKACDYALAQVIKETGLSLPPKMLDDPQYYGMSADRIYSLLPEEGEGNKDGDGENENDNDPGGCGGVEAPPASGGSGPPSPADIAQAEQDAIVNAEQAAQAAKGVGYLPGGVRELIDSIKKSDADYIYILREFLENISYNDYSYTHRNRRYEEFYIPSLRSKSLGPIVIYVDSSGSVFKELLNQVLGDAQSILDEMEPECIRVIQVDSKVQSDKVYYPGDNIDKECIGRGGTLFQPAFDHVAEKGYSPIVAIYFTDLMCGDTPKDPGYPVFWLTYGSETNHRITFGEIVKANLRR